MISISVKLLILFMYCFLDFTELSFCVCLAFFIAHWFSLKQLFLIIYHVSCISPYLLNSLLGNYWFSLVVSCVLDFLCSLKFCIYLHFWRSSYHQQSVETDFRKEKPCQPCQGYWGFLRPFLWINMLHTSCSLLWGNS